MLQFLLLLLVCQDQSPTQDLDTALLQSTVASQEAYKAHSRGDALMYRDALDKAKKAVIKPNVNEADGFGKNINGIYYVPNKKAQALAIEHYRAKLKAAEQEANRMFEQMLPIIDASKLSRGQAGFLGYSEYEPADIRVLQVLGPTSFLAKVGRETILIKEVSTEDVTDDKFVTLPRPVLVLGTERYSTVAGGTNTVFAVRLLSRDEFLKANEFVQKNKLRVKPIVRQWRDGLKELIVEGEFVTQDRVNVIIRDVSGKELQIPLSKLSREDRNWLKDQ